MNVAVIDCRQQRSRGKSRTGTSRGDAAVPVTSILTEDGWRTIDSSHDPHGEARRIAGGIADPGGHVTVLGIGSGYLLQALLARGVKRVLMITGSAVLAEKNVRLLQDLPDCEANVCIVAADQQSSRLRRILEARAGSIAAGALVYHPREVQAFRNLFNALGMYCEWLRRGAPVRGTQPVRTVVFAGKGNLFEPDIVAAFTRMGLQVVPVQTCADRNLTPEAALEALTRHRADAVVSTNNHASDRGGLIAAACQLAGIPWMSWFLDDPHFLVSAAEHHSLHGRVALCWDQAGIAACRALGFGRAELLPLATSPGLFHPGPGDPELRGRIVYVGSPSFGNEERYFAELLRCEPARMVAAGLEPFITRFRRAPTPAQVAATAAGLRIDLCRLTPLARRRLPAFALYRANLAYRTAVLNALADLQPVVYGQGWEGQLDPAIELRPYADYRRAVPRIYRSDAVHLSLTHLQMRSHPNQRVFDVGASGRIVLGERLPGMRDLFPAQIVEHLCFDDVRELRQRVAQLSAEPAARRELGETLRECVLQRHTIEVRVRQMLHVLQQPPARCAAPAA